MEYSDGKALVNQFGTISNVLDLRTLYFKHRLGKKMDAHRACLVSSDAVIMLRMGERCRKPGRLEHRSRTIHRQCEISE